MSELTSPVTLRLHTTARVKVKCPACDGTGTPHPMFFAYGYDKDNPPRCACHGSGTVTQAVTVNVEATQDMFDNDPYNYWLNKKRCEKHINALLTRYEAGEQVEGITEVKE